MKIGIIGAMQVEVVTLKEKLLNIKKTEKAGLKFYEGQLHGIDVILLQSGIGKVNAAVGTALLIDTFKPDYIINTGCAGGFSSEIKVGDIIISSDVLHHDMDCTVFGYEAGQIPGMPASFKADELLISLAEKAIHKLTDLKTKQGTITTGDQFMNNPEQTRKLKETFPQADAVEMEGAAIAQTCYQFKTPFVVIRAISDIAGQEHALEFTEFVEVAAINSAKMVVEMIRELAN